MQFTRTSTIQLGTMRCLLVLIVCMQFLQPVRGQDISIEVACFRGGYGIDFYEKCAAEYMELHKNVKINLWGSPRVWDQLTPRFAAGTPPDLCWPGWGTNVYSFIFEGQLKPLDTYLAAPALGVQKSWKDTFVKTLLEKGTHQGHIYTVPYNYDTFGWWYNKKMFRDHGWPVPRTYDDLLTVSELIKKSHIAPVTFAGRYPQYMLDGFFFPWMQRAGGVQSLTRLDDLTTGCWKDPAAMKAARTMMEMKKLGNFQSGAIGMTHIESQMEFLVGRAAMVPNGTWLYTEMRKMLPPGFEMEYMLCPNFTEGIGDPDAVTIAYDGRGWCVASASKNADTAADFLRYLTSPAVAKRFMEEKGTLMSIVDVDTKNLPPHLREPMRLISTAKTDYNVHYGEWYPVLTTAVQNALRDLYNELLTPEQFADKLEKAWDTQRKDPTSKRFR
jgi:N-acetylglucosamine transport system substrate-binding protein